MRPGRRRLRRSPRAPAAGRTGCCASGRSGPARRCLPCSWAASVSGRDPPAGGRHRAWEGLPDGAANNVGMGDPPQSPLLDQLIGRRVEKKGLRPRVAASVIAVLWLIAIVVFGIVERLVNPDAFDTIWLGMWWATQTVTTVGYGDVVPDQAAGQVIATVLMIGGLSLFAVITAVITSE